MSPIDPNIIVFEVLKWLVGTLIAWVLKMHSDVKDLKKGQDAAFDKIRELQNVNNKDSSGP